MLSEWRIGIVDLFACLLNRVHITTCLLKERIDCTLPYIRVLLLLHKACGLQYPLLTVASGYQSGINGRKVWYALL